MSSAGGFSSGPRILISPYQPDGGCSAESAGLLVLTSVLTGLILGVLLGIVAQGMYLIILFPCLIGLALGGVGLYSIQQGKVRNLGIAIGAAVVGGACAVVAMHYVDYYMFTKRRLESMSAEELSELQEMASRFDELRQHPTPENAEWIKYMEEHPRDLKAVQVDSLLGYVDLAAVDGVQIMNARDFHKDQKDLPLGRRPLNLGYYGSYVYWAVEGGLMVVIAVGMMRGAAARPFCRTCDEWKDWRMLGAVSHEGPARTALESGDLELLRTLNPIACPGEFNLSICCCATCGDKSPVELRLEKRTVHERYGAHDHPLLVVTVEGPTLDLLTGMFPPLPDEPDEIKAPEV